MGELMDFKYGTYVDRSYHQPADDKPSLKKGVVTTREPFKFGRPIHISEMTEARALNFYAERRQHVLPKG